MFITRAHAQENERNKKLYLRELYINESGIKASDCQYFLAFRLTSNYNLLHQLQKCQNEYLAQDSTVQPMLEQLEKKAHIPLNIIQCDETRLEELKKLIGKVVIKHREELANPPEIEVRGLGIERTRQCLYQPISIYTNFRNRNFDSKSPFDERDCWFYYIHQLFEDMLSESGFETFDHSLSEQMTLFRAKAGHEFKVKLKYLKPYATALFGVLTRMDLSSLHLCSLKSTEAPSEDGFYHIEETYVLNK